MPTHAALRGRITARGYEPPDGVDVRWRTREGFIVTKRLNRSIRWTGTDETYFGRYAEGDSTVKELQARPAEMIGDRAWHIVRDIYAQYGLPAPPSVGQEVWDFSIVELGRPAKCEDYARYLNVPRESPFPACGKAPEPPPPPQPTPPPEPPTPPVEPQPPAPLPPTLSPYSRDTVGMMAEWNVIGPGRRARLVALRRELKERGLAP